MDGLIKGLINVAIDAVEGAGRGERGDEDDAPRRHRPAREEEEEEGRGDERSRSTWAEVVSDHKGGDPEERPAHRNSRRDGRQERREDGDWETVGGRKQHQHNQYEEEGRRDNSNRRPQQQQQAPAYRRQQQDGGERADGGWQTVGEKKHHGKPQKSEAWNAYRRPPSEQQYCEDAGQIHHGLNVEPTREELNSLSKACSRLWELDMNRLTPGDDVLRKPTYSRFCALLDNYNPHQGYKEVVTEQDKHEEVAFIEEIARTAPIKGGSSSSSSAFEHVFVGEIKGRGQGENEFEWHGVLKSVSSTLIGVSPEFEVALYTLCFFMGGEDNRVEIGPYGVNIKCYRMGNSKIGSAFPIAEN
uniref:EndoU domain-containing protein n=1 Tax=Oryza punctata TaxID=4537 RepID=A0A0E0KTD9_ORYPU